MSCCMDLCLRAGAAASTLGGTAMCESLEGTEAACFSCEADGFAAARLGCRCGPVGTAWLFGAANGLKLAWLDLPAGGQARLCDLLVTPDGKEEDV